VLCGVKEEEWAQVQEPAKNPAAGRATAGTVLILSLAIG